MPNNQPAPRRALAFIAPIAVLSGLLLSALLQPTPGIAQQGRTPSPTPWVVTATPTPADVFAAATRSAEQTRRAETTGTPTSTPRNMLLATVTPTARIVTSTPTPANSATATAQMLLATAIAFTTGTPDPNQRLVTATPTPTLFVITPTPRPANVLEEATRQAERIAQEASGETPTPRPKNIIVATVTPTARVVTNTPPPTNSATAAAQRIVATAIAFTTGQPNVITATPTRTPNALQATRTAMAVRAAATLTPTLASTSTLTHTTSTATPTSQTTPTPVAAQNTPQAASPNVPRIDNFMACTGLCVDNANRATFPEATQIVYLFYHFENIPENVVYARTWSQDGEVWVRYECTWPGPESGDFDFVLSEPAGLRSGPWELTVEIDGVTLLREQIRVEGDWTYWDPVGTVEGDCQGIDPYS